MTLMSRKVDYALLILSYLDQKQEGACAREIADHYGISKGFVGNILKALCTQEFVESHRGVKGGYVLSRSMATVNLAELMEALDDELYLAECTKPEEDGCSLTAICPVRGSISTLHGRIRDVLRTVMLSELFPQTSLSGETQYGLELGSKENELLA